MTNSDHEHRHAHLATGNFWWHSHPHTCDGDFNRLHHHAPAEHEGKLFGPPRIDGNYRTNLHDQGWRP